MGIASIKALRDERPWVPRRFVRDLRTWCEEERRRIGWYASQRGPVFVSQTMPRLHISRAVFRYLTSNELSDLAPRYVPLRVWREPEQFWCSLQNVFVYAPDGAVRSLANECFNELSPNWEVRLGATASSPRDRKWSLAPTITVDVPAAVISVPGYDSYYHWLLQMLPRALNIARHLATIERVYVSPGLSEAQIAFLAVAGVRRETLREIKPDQRYRFHHLLASSIPGGEGALSQWAIEGLRAISIGPSAQGKRLRVYLVRGGRRRRVLNEEAVIAACVARDFTILDGTKVSVTEQASVLSQAEHVVSAHGAALSNIVFARRCNVLELFPPNAVVDNCFNHLSEKCGHRYAWAVSGRERTTAAGDFMVDMDHFNRVIDAFLDA